MKKILVTTDFSNKAKTGLRFAIQLASQQVVELTFFYTYHLIKPTIWSDADFASYKKNEAAKNEKKLRQYVNSIYKNKGIIPKNIKYVVKEAIFADSSIREYALNNHFDFICAGTRGAGFQKKILGSTTTSLINFSTVPIIAIPQNYRMNSIKKLLYLSDLTDLDNELKKVADFAKPLGAKVALLHFTSPDGLLDKKYKIAEAVKKCEKGAVDFYFKDFKKTDRLISKINDFATLFKPSMIIMFTKPNKGFIEKMFYGSNSENYAINAKVPLLVFNKKD